MTARCKRCHRVLRDPVSQAVGLGPECRGASGRSGVKAGVRSKGGRPKVYCPVGSSVTVNGHVISNTVNGPTLDGNGGLFMARWLSENYPSVVLVASVEVGSSESMVQEASQGGQL